MLYLLHYIQIVMDFLTQLILKFLEIFYLINTNLYFILLN